MKAFYRDVGSPASCRLRLTARNASSNGGSERLGDRWALTRHASAVVTRDAWDPRLTGAALEYLAGRPLRWDAVIDGVRVALRHGTPRSDMEGIDPLVASLGDARRWLAAAEADVLLVGHTHLPFALTTLTGDLIANPGALLRSPKVRPEQSSFGQEQGAFVPPAGGTFGVLELPARTFKVLRAADGAEVEIPRITLGVQDLRGR